MCNKMSSNDHMNLSVNGHSQVPPGFRFHPTEDELLHYYLKKKVASQKIDLDVIRDVDLNKLEPWDIQERCKIGSTPQNDWYFFSHKDKKYPTGSRTNRATAAGFWKATGRDKVICSSSRRIGMRKTLVFYMGRAPHGQKSDWIMHEYRLDDHHHHNILNDNINHDDDHVSPFSTESLKYAQASSSSNSQMQEDGWVVCRVFTKKNYQRATEISPKMSYRAPPPPPPPPHHQIMQVQRDYSNNQVLDQLLVHMGKNCKHENKFNEEMQMRDKFHHLPRLDGSPVSYRSMNEEHMSDWVALDQLVASQLNGSCGGDGGGFDFCEERHNDEGASLVLSDELLPMNHFNRSMSTNQEASQHVVYCNEVVDLWTFSSNHGSSSNSSSDPLGQLSG